jgi:hypothetical protein
MGEAKKRMLASFAIPITIRPMDKRSLLHLYNMKRILYNMKGEKNPLSILLFLEHILILGQVYNQGTQKACLTSKSANVSVSNESIL